jgi:hypothetical protein
VLYRIIITGNKGVSLQSADNDLTYYFTKQKYDKTKTYQIVSVTVLTEIYSVHLNEETCFRKLIICFGKVSFYKFKKFKTCN